MTSERTLPPDFTQVTPEDVLIHIATDQDSLEDLWDYFGMQTGVPAPAWDQQVVLLLGTGDQVAGRLVIHLEQRTKWPYACLMDFTPRTFALALPRSLLHAGWR